MQRIDSPSAVANMFGAGKNGFSDVFPNKTQLNATWFNEIQEELANILEDQSIALDGLQLDQIAQAINNWQFSGDIAIKSGAELRILSGGDLIADAGSDPTFNAMTTCTAGLNVTFASGAALEVTGVGAFNGIIAGGGTTGIGVAAAGGSTSGHGVQGTAQGANSYGVAGVGANVATSHGVVGTATNTSAYGTVGTTASGATTTAAGVFANALGDGNAVSAMAVNGNAGVFQSDTSSPARAAVRIVPQDADPTTAQAGALFNASSRNGKMRIHTGTAYESVHSSTKGHVFAWAEAADDVQISSGDLATVTIVPEQTGTVLIEASGVFSMADAGHSFDIDIIDVTAATVIRSVIFPQGVAGERTSQSVRAVYTLPSAASRQFAFQVNSNNVTNVTYSACVLSVVGVG